MRVDLTLNDRSGRRRDVAVCAPDGALFDDVAGSLAELCAVDADIAWWAHGERLHAAVPLGGAGLRSGTVVSIGVPADPDSVAGSVSRLQVVGGPDAGRLIGLSRGILTVGRAPDCDLVLTDPDVSRRQASITVTSAGIRVHDLHSTNGTSIAERPVDPEGTDLRHGELLRVGDSFLSLADGDEPPAALRQTADGALLLNRAPRAQPVLGSHTVEIPEHPARRAAHRIQWIAALLPMLAGIGLALAMHSAQFLMIFLLSPVFILASALGDRWYWRRDQRRDAATLTRGLAAAHDHVSAGLRAETAARRRATPDPATLGRVASVHGARLWERRRTDEDALFVRLGLADVPSALQIRRVGVTTSAGWARAVPTGVDLRAGPLGVAAPRAIALGLARWLVGQLAVLHSPADIEFALLLADGAEPEWTWTRWLPHLRTRIATTPADRDRLVAELTREVERRLGARRGGSWAGAWLVVVVDGAGSLSDVPGLAALLSRGPTAGVTAICMDGLAQQLPTACAATATACGETGTRLRVRSSDGAELLEAVCDQVTPHWADTVARALCPVADAAADTDAGLPDQCRLLEMLSLPDPDAAALRTRWQRSDAVPSTVVGIGSSGPVTVDLLRDGPHALVAGTTGAGKSELLQSLVAGLAANHPPEAISFVLIDYKGGAAFGECARLPHVAGLVTDLDAHLTVRALQSLERELRRREQLLADAGVQDLDAYRAAGRSLEPLARLVLVVDEFATLAAELPDFISGLVGIAQRGRSLGLHLVLATQRPAGVVSPEIRANANLRVALRVSDPAESIDVIGVDAASEIDARRPGRGYLRTGSSLTQFQTAQVNTAPPVHDGAASVRVAQLDSWRRLPTAPIAPPSDKTDLQLLVDAARQAAAGAPAPRRPWLPPLPSMLPARSLPPPPLATTVPFGLADLPEQQTQLPIDVCLDTGGSMLFTGSARSGRTSALVTIAVSAAARLDAAQLQIYAIDAAGGGLSVLSGLPHCATLASSVDFDVAAALVHRLDVEVARRRGRMAELGFGSVSEARAAGEELPLLLCVIDGWEGLVAAADEYDGGRTVEVLIGLLRTAPAAALTVVLSGDRATLAPRLANTVATKCLLRLSDRADYAGAGISARAVPDEMPPGRAIRASDSAELQIAFVGARPSRAEQSAAIAELASRSRTTSPPPRHGIAPIRVRRLPDRVRRDELSAASGRFRLGLGGDEAEPVAIDLFAGAARLLVSGPGRSGRSTALCTILLEAADIGVAVLVAAPRRSPLVAAARRQQIPVVSPDDVSGSPPELGFGTPTLLLVDDSAEFLDTGAGDMLTRVLRQAPAQLSVAVSGSSDELALSFRGVAAEVRRSRCALLLQPSPVDGELVGLRLPRHRPRAIAGRGLLVGDPAWGEQFATGPIPIQVAMP